MCVFVKCARGKTIDREGVDRGSQIFASRLAVPCLPVCVKEARTTPPLLLLFRQKGVYLDNKTNDCCRVLLFFFNKKQMK